MALISPNDEQFDLLLHKLKERLEEGHGETIYEIGVGGEPVSFPCTLNVKHCSLMNHNLSCHVIIDVTLVVSDIIINIIII